MNFKLIPKNNVAQSASNFYQYLALNNDPQFEIDRCSELAGKACLFKAKITASYFAHKYSILYLDYGKGFSEAEIIRLFLDHEGNINQEIVIPTKTVNVRFDPIAQDGDFSIEEFELRLLEKNNENLSEILLKQKEDLSKYLNENFDETLYWNKVYLNWINLYESPKEKYGTLFNEINNWSTQPLISVVMPTYNSNELWLRKAIESVMNQIYPNWELCISDDCSKDTKIKDILQEYSQLDSRIKFVLRKENGHISAATNSAIEISTGEWIALLDHDDMLHPEALFWVAKAINRFPTVSLIYTDEDKIDELDNRTGPYFKTDWNKQLFYSHNLITHLGVYRKSLLEKIGNFRIGFEGAQDYDLALRCIEHISSDGIHHIPKVLYHWRLHPESTAKTSEAKPYAMIAGERALNEHFERIKLQAKSELIGHGYRTRYALPPSNPLVSLIIPTRNGLNYLEKCIESILKKTTYLNYEILIIDNGSDEKETIDYLNFIKSNSKIKVIRDERPFNYSQLNNLGVSKASGEIIGLINNDIEVISPDWLSEMVSVAIQNDVGCVGAKLLYSDGKIQHAGVMLGIGGWAGHSHKGFPGNTKGYFGRVDLMSEFSAVTGACLLIKKDLFNDLGGLDEENLKVACNDVDLCLKAKLAGFRNIYTPYAEHYHHESATRGYEDSPEKKARFNAEVLYMQKKWGDELYYDPHYSRNLTLNSEDFTYGFPPRLIKYESTLDFKNKIDKALYFIKKEGVGLEIGPSHNPLTRKRDGYKVEILDHLSKDDLIEKYKNHNINLNNIEEVDYIWQGEPLHHLIGKTSHYDWIVASHVIEHIPDLLGFLQQCEFLLKENGIISLVIPDKRFCFDYFNKLTTTGQVLDAHLDKRNKPTPGQIFDYWANSVTKGGEIGWNINNLGDLELIHSIESASEMFYKSINGDDYIDVHCWRFTPESFKLILLDLNRLRYINYEIVKEFQNSEHEFFITLKKNNYKEMFDRLQLLEKMSQ